MAVLDLRSIVRCFALALLVGCVGLAARATQASSVREGKPFPQVSLIDTRGQRAALELPRRGTVLIQVWATWCAPCHEALPALLAAVSSIGQDNSVTIVLWNIDTDGARAKRFLTERVPRLAGVDLRFDPGGEQFRRLGAPGMPATFVVVDGIVQNVFGGYEPGMEQKVLAALEKALDRGSGSPPR